MSEPDLAPDPAAAAARINPATYRLHIDTTFQVERGPDRIPVRLAEVAGERTGGGYLRFSLLFHGPADRLLPQDSYLFHHDALGELMLFIVPVVGSNAERIVYEACFTRPLPSTPAS